MAMQYWIDNCAPTYCFDCAEENGGCKYDQNIVCSPDCEQLLPSGEPPLNDECSKCDPLDLVLRFKEHLEEHIHSKGGFYLCIKE